MKKKESKKFSLEKFEVVKLNNLRTLIGGDGTEGGDGPKTTGNNTNVPIKTLTSISDPKGF
ncbi:hypothetical protein [Flavobacterium sp.]|uniref:hypothetical protein n=1 Tax=Flavobacterium sp. TaxID=239 RepID=UPI004048343D